MSILLQKAILASIVMGLAIFQVLTMGQVRRWFTIFPLNRRQLRTVHKIGGDLTLALAASVAGLCISNFGFRASPPRVPLHTAFGSLAILVMLVKVGVARGYRRAARHQLSLGIVAGLAVLGVFSASALYYFLVMAPL